MIGVKMDALYAEKNYDTRGRSLWNSRPKRHSLEEQSQAANEFIHTAVQSHGKQRNVSKHAFNTAKNRRGIAITTRQAGEWVGYSEA
jgi:hypothetical protein